MNERIHFKPCKKRIVGGSRYIHEESAVQNIIGKAALLAFDMAVFLVDLGRLGKSCKLLVDGLRDKDSGVLGPKGKRQDSTVFQKRDEIQDQFNKITGNVAGAGILNSREFIASDKTAVSKPTFQPYL